MDAPLVDKFRLDASTFQQQLRELSETVAQKVHREANARWNAPSYVSADIFVLMRQAMHTCDLLCFINADERREQDCNWRPAYTFVTAPLVRSLIDSLYNITFILEDPRFNGPAFRKSGAKKALQALDDDEARYGDKPDWNAYIKEKRLAIDFAIRECGLDMAGVLAQERWKTLGQYLGSLGPGGTLNAHQSFLKTFTFGMWREYSAMVHGGFDGLLDSALFFTRDSVLPEMRAKMDERFPWMMSLHLFRAALILLCIVTEIQAYFRFDGARINTRIHEVWNALMPVFEVKELYDERYANLMRDRGITP